MEIKFINITEEDFSSKKFLNKYMSLESALKTLNNKKLWFANPSIWKDPFEKRFIEAKYDDSTKISDFIWKDRIFCICMTQTATSEAYWNTYSQKQIGIEFKIVRKTLLEELNRYTSQYDIYIGKVEYMKTSNIKHAINKIPFAKPIPKSQSPEWYARLLLLKRIAYKYEDEIRIIMIKKDKTKESGIYLDYQCENTDLIKLIFLDPSIQDNITNLLKEVFENKYRFTTIKNTHRVMKSQLYAKQKPQNLKI